MESIPIGPATPILAGVTYATPAVVVTSTSGVVLQSSILEAGPFTALSGPSAVLITGCFVKCASDTTVTLTRKVV